MQISDIVLDRSFYARTNCDTQFLPKVERQKACCTSRHTRHHCLTFQLFQRRQYGISVLRNSREYTDFACSACAFRTRRKDTRSISVERLEERLILGHIQDTLAPRQLNLERLVLQLRLVLGREVFDIESSDGECSTSLFYCGNESFRTTAVYLQSLGILICQILDVEATLLVFGPDRGVRVL